MPQCRYWSLPRQRAAQANNAAISRLEKEHLAESIIKEVAMFKKMLVPLDGSSFSEICLEQAKAIAKGCSVPEVILFKVVEPVPGYAGVGEDWQAESEKRAREWTKSYLASVAEQLKKEGIEARTAMAEGNAAEEILEYANKNKVDLIVMSTHGSSGVVRWVLGSVADRVLRHAHCPVLVVSPHGARSSK